MIATNDYVHNWFSELVISELFQNFISPAVATHVGQCNCEVCLTHANPVTADRDVG
jgi:hypothetical protein